MYCFKFNTIQCTKTVVMQFPPQTFQGLRTYSTSMQSLAGIGRHTEIEDTKTKVYFCHAPEMGVARFRYDVVRPFNEVQPVASLGREDGPPG